MSNLKCLKGVGEASVQKLSRLGIFTIQDLLFHLPRSYQDRTRVIPISQAPLMAMTAQEMLIEGEILEAQITFGRRRSLLCYLKDPKYPEKLLVLRFFYFNAGQKNQFIPGRMVRAYGEYRLRKGQGEMIHPEYQVYEKHSFPPIDAVLTPVYSLSEGLSQTRLRQWMRQAFEWTLTHPEYLIELLPLEDVQKLSLIEALRIVHFPPKTESVEDLLLMRHAAQQRLIIEELLAHRLTMEKIRALKAKIPASPFIKQNRFEPKVREVLPFSLTKAQERVIQEIAADLQKNTAMHRLLQGDVGSGKTLVAMMAALQVVEHQAQVAIMVPTEILAEQHYLNFLKYWGDLPLKVSLLTSSLNLKKKEAVRQGTALGEVDILIGTQALFQEGVDFKHLGLVIIDEQHRFGVEQRQALLDKAGMRGGVHQLIMTATPIPRTLAMTSYADLNISIIDELPKGRKPVSTLLVNQDRRAEVIEKIHHKVAEGRQVYWVCTLIEESEHLDFQAAEDVFLQLKKSLPTLRIGLLHGRVKPLEKQKIMESFKSKNLDILVATTVIEVGVDVPNASLMVIENPERLGLAQLHQLRGRVGRGQEESFCILLYQMPLSNLARERLTCLKATSNGFDIAEKDLELRGAGEVLGTRQTGEVDFKIANLIRDRALLPQVKKISEALNEKYKTKPEILNDLSEAMIQRWLGHIFIKS